MNMDSMLPRVPVAGKGTLFRGEKDASSVAGDVDGRTSPGGFAALLGDLKEASPPSSEDDSAVPEPRRAETTDTAASADRNALWQQVAPLLTPPPLDAVPVKLGPSSGEAADGTGDAADDPTATGQGDGSGGAGVDLLQGEGVAVVSPRVWRFDPSGNQAGSPVAAEPLGNATSAFGAPLDPASGIDDGRVGVGAQFEGEQMSFRDAPTGMNDDAPPAASAPLRSLVSAPSWGAGESDGFVSLLSPAGVETQERTARSVQIRPPEAPEPLIGLDLTASGADLLSTPPASALPAGLAAVEGGGKSVEPTMAPATSRVALVQPEGRRLDGAAEQRRAFFAARVGVAPVATDLSVEVPVSDSVNVEGELVANYNKAVGTHVANRGADVMRAIPIPATATFLTPEDSLVQQGEAARGDVLPEAAPEAVAAGRAVQKVLESMAGSEQRVASSVVLRFKIGADDLAVRIGMIAGHPTAEFHTQSAQVREAVLREWQASIPVDSPLRVREPVFVSGFSADSREGQPRQQDGRSSGRPQREEFAALPFGVSSRAARDQPSRVRAETGTPASGILSVFA